MTVVWIVGFAGLLGSPAELQKVTTVFILASYSALPGLNLGACWIGSVSFLHS